MPRSDLGFFSSVFEVSAYIMALVIGGAWVVAVPGQCLGLGGACVPWWPVLVAWVLGGVVVW